MSTFNGIVTEFPDIRVDFFRNNPSFRPPLACFLSHVHSDHLAGLESLRSPFVYCSSATREMLLRLERYPCRINQAKGILEGRVQTYKHLKSLLKPIPLETPTTLELQPGKRIRVTLFDANHCTGAVMFLFEAEGRAVLYTGDVRSEPWHVNSLARSPCLVEYSSQIRVLDKIYLDTSFIEDIAFPTKADGIKELLRKVAKYPKDAIFHFQAWTFGYEQVWIALSKALDSRIHVDDYKLRLYKSLVSSHLKGSSGSTQFHVGPEVAALVGFVVGNTTHPGCLTSDERVRIHSCERGNFCATVRNSPGVVYIEPIITRRPGGVDVAELGVGGGGDDLEREADLDLLSPWEIQSLLEIVSNNPAITDNARARVKELLLSAVTSRQKFTLDLAVSAFSDDLETDIVSAMNSIAKKPQLAGQGRPQPDHDQTAGIGPLPRTITFPYSRHSSYPELCHLVQIFKPKDIWPCTVNEAEWVKNETTIKGLFGEHCSGDIFKHDLRMAEKFPKPTTRGGEPGSEDTQVTRSSPETSFEEANGRHQTGAEGWPHTSPVRVEEPLGSVQNSARPLGCPAARKRSFGRYMSCNDDGAAEVRVQGEEAGKGDDPEDDSEEEASFHPEDATLNDSQGSELSDWALEIRRAAFNAILDNARGGGEYKPIGLISVDDGHSTPEVELGTPTRKHKQRARTG